MSQTQENNQENTLYEHHKLIVDPGQKQIRLDQYIAGHLDGWTRSQILKVAKEGGIFVNGKREKPSYKVKPNDVITIMLPEPKEPWEIVPQDLPLDIVYEDQDLIVVNKPAGMVVHPAYGHYKGTLMNALAYHLREAPVFADPNLRAGMVHRIDKDTSGLLVVAKTPQAHAHLAAQFAAHTTSRKYIALIWGNLKSDQGTITGHIGRHPKNRQIMAVYPDGSHGKHAVTHWKVLERFYFTTLVELTLETGRTHQIRAHMKHLGHPLFGDKDYGGDKILYGIKSRRYQQFVRNTLEILPRQALHAKTLGFIHPRTNQPMLFDSPLPGDMAQAIERWRKFAQAYGNSEDFDVKNL